MKFDTYKWWSGSNIYHHMSEEKLAFHNALGRRISSDYETIDYINFGESRKRRNVNPRVIIDAHTGDIRFVLSLNHKVDKAMVKLSDIQSCLDEFVDFIGVCCDYGYLVSEKPKEAAYAAENE